MKALLIFFLVNFVIPSDIMAQHIFEAEIRARVNTQCSSCHGATGFSPNSIWPNLNGQNKAYIAKQLLSFRDKTRKNNYMNHYAQSLSDQDIDQVSSYYSSQPRIEIKPSGKIPDKLSTCIACHGELGISQAENMPHLAGQKKEYVLQQLKAFKSGVRPDPVMSSIVANLSEKDFEELSTWYEGCEGCLTPGGIAPQ